MAQSHEAGNPTVTAENPITDLLSAPLSPDWTIEGLAEQLLCTIASQPKEEVKKLLLDAAATTDRQSQRVLRPLLACLATKSAAEAGRLPTSTGASSGSRGSVPRVRFGFWASSKTSREVCVSLSAGHLPHHRIPNREQVTRQSLSAPTRQTATSVSKADRKTSIGGPDFGIPRRDDGRSRAVVSCWPALLDLRKEQLLRISDSAVERTS